MGDALAVCACGHTWISHDPTADYLCGVIVRNPDDKRQVMRCPCAKFQGEQTMAEHAHGELRHANHFWVQGDGHDHR